MAEMGDDDDEGFRIADDERGIVRVFAIDVPAAEARRWTDTDAPDWALPYALGFRTLNAQDVQVFTRDDLAGMSLAEFLEQGYDITEAQLASDRVRLDAAEGVFAVVRSGAFPRTPARLGALARHVRLLGTFAEPSVAPSPRAGMGTFESARPGSGDAAPAAEAPEEPAQADDGARVVERFRPDRDTYIRAHLWLAAAGMVGATFVLYLLGNADYWVGAVAALLAIAVRGAYLASEELGMRWELTETSVRGVSAEGRMTRSVTLRDIARVRKLGSAVQIVTKGGDKLLMKYLPDPEEVRRRLARAAGVPAT